MRGKRRLAIMISVPLLLAALASGGFWLQDQLGEAGGGPCLAGPKADSPVVCLGDLPTSACHIIPETGLPSPGDPDFCRYASYPHFTPAPTSYRNEAAILTAPPVHRVGDAVALGRVDCPLGWQAAVSDTTGMSVCFPGDIGDVTVGRTGSDVQEEDRFEITLSGANLPALVTINVIRSAGRTGPYSLDCQAPDLKPVLGMPAKTCIWPQGKNETFESATPLFITAHQIEKSGFDWIFEAVVWGVVGQPRPDVSPLRTVIADILVTLRLP